MSEYVIDAYAWIEYLRGTRAGERVKAVFEEENIETYTCAVTVAEVASKTVREGQDVDVAYRILLNNSQVVNVDEEVSRRAGLLHAEMRRSEKDFGLADAYVLATARKLKSRVLTGDPHFRGVKEADLIE
jgi:predicted nucleic acid-binding protein